MAGQDRETPVIPCVSSPKIALGLLLTGRLISAQEAHRLGLVNEVVPSTDTADTADSGGAASAGTAGGSSLSGAASGTGPISPVLAAARRWAAEIMAASPLAVQATKQAALLGLDQPLSDAIGEAQYPAIQRLRASEDPVEGPQAFAEKRPPRWTPL